MLILQDLETCRQAFLTVAELAHYWRISERTIYRHIEKGALPVTRVGPHGRVRIRIADAIRYGRPSEAADVCDITATRGQQ